MLTENASGVRPRRVWAEESVCKGLDIFFPDGGRPGKESEQKAVCATCPVVYECMVWAIAHDAYGVWGNTTRHERHRLHKKYYSNIKEQALEEGWYEGTGLDEIESKVYATRRLLKIEIQTAAGQTGLIQFEELTFHAL